MSELLSESNLERVWRDEDGTVRIEWTEAGQEFQRRRAERDAGGRRRTWIWPAAFLVVAGVSAAIGRSLG